MNEKPEFPMRINKYLASQRVTTRKGADKLIEKKNVIINGRIAVLGDKVNENDVVEVLQTRKPQEFLYYAYYKPTGVITHSPQNGEADVRKSLPTLKNIFPIGRLDKDSEGLMILTNDGRITDSLLNPKFEHDKEYVVTTKEKLRANFKERMEAGVNIEGYTTKDCKVKILDDNKFQVTLTEGKKHQIRRMCVALFNEVRDLKRTRIMNIKIGTMKSGEFRQIKGEELAEFLELLGF